MNDNGFSKNDGAGNPGGKPKAVFCSLAAAMAIMAVVGCVSTPPKEMEPVKLAGSLDVDRYLGRWYEIARYQSGFEKNIYGATAEYSLRKDGKIQVVNSGFKNSLDGKYTEVKAVAWIPDPAVPAALKVRFFRLFAADYLVIGLDDKHYEWAIVGNNSRNFLWFLARTPVIDDTLYAKMEEIARSQGFDTTTLFKVPQKPRD